ncbi:hypothetical protein [Paenibacillus tepidiphilus]|uniref:hypothetical protein n=1 Tax=Paenibacillus tepidiphilus TaxID=2608683 RepID=UPI00123BBC60|nr:hypothetical protein [Paenibacillus tepidiphilus]
MRKKIIAIITALILVITCLPVNAFAATAQQNAAGQYYFIIQDIINKYRICTEEYAECSSGLAYAELIDFNKDGLSELFAIYMEDSGEYTLGVWSFANNKVSRIFTSKQIVTPQNGISWYLLNTNKQTYLVEDFEYGTGLGDAPYSTVYFSDYKFHTVSNNKFVAAGHTEYKQEYHDTNGSMRETYSIKVNNTQTKVNKAKYDQYLAKFDLSKAKTLISNDVGLVEFGFNTANNAKMMHDFLLKSKATYREGTYKNVFSTQPLQKKHGITAFLNYFNNTMNSYSYDNKQNSNQQIVDFIVSARFEGKLSNDSFVQDSSKTSYQDKNGFEYYPYKKATVDALTKKLFGITLQAKNYDSAVYKDGYYYFLSPEIGGDPSSYSSQVNMLISLGSGLYYAEFTTFTFENDADVNEDNLDKIMGTWPESDRQLAYDSLQYGGLQNGYAIVKEVTINGKQTWQLVKYSPNGGLLGNAQLKAYK